jgi:hypothetical protein
MGGIIPEPVWFSIYPKIIKKTHFQPVYTQYLTLPYRPQKQSQNLRLIEKNNPFLGVCFLKQFLPAGPKTVKRPTKPFKNARNLGFNTYLPPYSCLFLPLLGINPGCFEKTLSRNP